MTVGEDAVETRQTSRGIPAGSGIDMENFTFPETLPPFRVGATLVSPRGEAWVKRITPVGQPSRYEVFDKNGSRLGFVELPPGSKILDFGSKPDSENMVYLARTDDLGLVWLGRYRVIREGV